METLPFILVAVAACALACRAAAFLLGMAAWVGLVLMTLSALVGETVPPSAFFVTVGCWAASQAASRVRHGYWRSPLLRSPSR